MLVEVCVTWPKIWDEYVSPACWIKRHLSDPTLPNNMTLFELMFGRKPHVSLDTLVPEVYYTDKLEEWTTLWIVEDKTSGKNVLLWKIAIRPTTRSKLHNHKRVDRNNCSSNWRFRLSILGSNTYRDGFDGKLEDERWTGPRKINKTYTQA